MLLNGSLFRFFASVIFLVVVSTSVLAQRAAAPVKVESVSEAAILNQLQLIGTVTSPQVAMLSTQTNGLVQRVAVEDGSVVEQGELLLQLDSELAELDLASAEAAVAQADQALADARRRLREVQSLVKERSIAASTVRDIEAEVVMDEAFLQQAIAQRDYQRAVLARHQLKAPFAGVVSRKLVEQGEWVTTGAGVFELVASQNLRLDFFVAEDYLAQVNAEGTIRFTLNAYPDQVLQGKIKTIVPVTDPGARTFLLRVDILPQQGLPRMIPGMSAQATLQLPTGRAGIVVPRDAIIRNPDGRITVWTVMENDGELTVKENRVTTGLIFDGRVEVLQGLPDNAQVVVQGNEALRNGQRVVIVE